MQEVNLKPDVFVKDSDEVLNNEPLFVLCNFCEKEEKVYQYTAMILNSINKNNLTYCSWCTRKKYNSKKTQNVLILSFRSLIGYLYYAKYRYPYVTSLYLSDLADMIRNHVKIGLLNPLFDYDPDSYCWFVDFSRVGTTSKKVDVQFIKNTVSEIVTAFNIFDTVENIELHQYVNKFHEAIDVFYNSRTRPKDKTLLIPTLKQCGTVEVSIATNKTQNKKRNISHDDCRKFIARDLLIQNPS